MNLKKKILAITIGPVLILGIITILFTVTMVKNSMMDETKDALKGTAAATLAAYDQNTGDYLETSNGDIWKGSYNISKSENLVDRIKDNTGMDVTFFYGDKRIMTSAMDENGNRILKSKAGDVIVEKVLNGGEEYFSEAVSIEGTLNYGYFMPVYQNGSDTDIVGMVFVGTNKQDKDAVVMRLLGSIVAAVVAIMLVCLLVSTKLVSTISRNIRTSIKTVEKIAAGDLNVQVNNKLLKLKFLDSDSTESVLSGVNKSYDVETNILFANISEIQERVLGIIIVQIVGSVEAIDGAQQYFTKHGVGYTEIGL